MDWSIIIDWVKLVATEYGWFVATLLIMNIYHIRQIGKLNDTIEGFNKLITDFMEQARKDDREDFDRVLGIATAQSEKFADLSHAVKNATSSVDGLARIVQAVVFDLKGRRK